MSPCTHCLSPTNLRSVCLLAQPPELQSATRGKPLPLRLSSMASMCPVPYSLVRMRSSSCPPTSSLHMSLHPRKLHVFRWETPQHTPTKCPELSVPFFPVNVRRSRFLFYLKGEPMGGDTHFWGILLYQVNIPLLSISTSFLTPSYHTRKLQPGFCLLQANHISFSPPSVPSRQTPAPLP